MVYQLRLSSTFPAVFTFLFWNDRMIKPNRKLSFIFGRRIEEARMSFTQQPRHHGILPDGLLVNKIADKSNEPALPLAFPHSLRGIISDSRVQSRQGANQTRPPSWQLNCPSMTMQIFWFLVPFISVVGLLRDASRNSKGGMLSVSLGLIPLEMASTFSFNYLLNSLTDFANFVLKRTPVIYVMLTFLLFFLLFLNFFLSFIFIPSNYSFIPSFFFLLVSSFFHFHLLQYHSLVLFISFSTSFYFSNFFLFSKISFNYVSLSLSIFFFYFL